MGDRRGLALLLLLFPVAAPGQAAPTLRTRWAAQVDAEHPWPEYPRPQLVRGEWQSLNGPWDYAITAREAGRPARWNGRIVVPFAPESQLSGVRRAVTDCQRLWYRRRFAAPARRPGQRVLLHFDAVDWEAEVWVNRVRVGTHRGGYDPFGFDVTDALTRAGTQEILLGVWDPTDRGPQPRGKQVLRPHGIWYSAVSGIWQSVWIETVPDVHITALDLRADLDRSVLVVRADVVAAPAGTMIRAVALDHGRAVARAEGAVGEPLALTIPDVHPWSPDDPFLYDLAISLSSGDSVTSYFGMRKIAVRRDSSGTPRLFLNNRPLFQLGLLDQGWWPDGLYTAPTDAALRADIETTRALGFNLARKHVKVEPDRWYYWADRLGLLVWQDMPSGENDTPEAQAEFALELRHVVDARRDHPSVVVWVPFNEGWGQHDTERITHWLAEYDPTRLVNNASGWEDARVGDLADVHDYPGPAAPRADGRRARVLGEFGGLGLPVEGHTWVPAGNWGYRRFGDTTALTATYRGLLELLRPLVARGLSAAVYTQTTDVEVEVNGVMTYDRAVVKLPPAAAAANRRLWREGPDTVTTPSIRRDPFGRTPEGDDVQLYTLTNARGTALRLMTYGATIVSLTAPDRDGHFADIVLGYDDLAGYLEASPYFGAVVGRYANRIAQGRFSLDGTTYQLATNNGPNHLHGGRRGFDKVIWDALPQRTDSGVGVALSYRSPDGEEGYPGTLDARVTYTLTDDDRVIVDYAATTDRPTIVNLSQHSYWNLAGEGSGDVLRQRLQIDADRYTPVDSTLIPTGELAPVEGTPFDFRTATLIGARIDLADPQLKNGHGYDHNFVLDRSGPGLAHAARLTDPQSGRTLDVWTTEPGLQVYSGNFLDGSITGKAGHVYRFRGALALEPQHYPDSPNQPGFPPVTLRPGEEYRSRTIFALGVSR